MTPRVSLVSLHRLTLACPHVRLRVQERKRKCACSFFKCLFESSLYFPLAKACHMVKPRVTVGGHDQRRGLRKVALSNCQVPCGRRRPPCSHSRDPLSTCTQDPQEVLLPTAQQAWQEAWLAPTSHFCPQLMMFESFGYNILVKIV